MYHKLLHEQIRNYLPAELIGQTRMNAFLESINGTYTRHLRELEAADPSFRTGHAGIGAENRALNARTDQGTHTPAALSGQESSFHEHLRITQLDGIEAPSRKVDRPEGFIKDANEALTFNIDLFKTMLGNLQSGILVENEHREILFTNQLFCTTFKIPVDPDRLVGTDCSRGAEQCKELFRKPQKFLDGVNKLIRDRKPVYNQVLETVDGRMLERDYVPIYINDVYRGHLWKYTDTTNDVLYRRILRESEERNRMVLNSSLDAIVIADGTGTVRYWNPRAEQLFGWSWDEANSLLLASLFVSRPGDQTGGRTGIPARRLARTARSGNGSHGDRQGGQRVSRRAQRGLLRTGREAVLLRVHQRHLLPQQGGEPPQGTGEEVPQCD